MTTDDGPVAIRDIDVGDQVLAWDEGLAASGYYTVTAVWAHEDPVTVLLTVNGETIETTPEHPFLTVDDTWVTAGELAVGDTLRSADGDVGVVEEITFVAAPQVMYNMTVAVVHTYAVGDGEWVVHNACHPVYPLCRYSYGAVTIDGILWYYAAVGLKTEDLGYSIRERNFSFQTDLSIVDRSVNRYRDDLMYPPEEM